MAEKRLAMYSENENGNGFRLGRSDGSLQLVYPEAGGGVNIRSLNKLEYHWNSVAGN